MKYQRYRRRGSKRRSQDERAEAERQQALSLSIQEMAEEDANAEYREGRRRLGGANDASPCFVRIGFEPAKELSAGFRGKKDLKALRRSDAGQDFVLGCCLGASEQVFADGAIDEPDHPCPSPENSQNCKFTLVQVELLLTTTTAEQNYGKHTGLVPEALPCDRGGVI